MPEIGMSVSMSGDGKRSVGHRPQATAPILDSTADRPEVLGSKEKTWLNPDRQLDLPARRHLFKVGRPNTGENWAEKVCSEILKVLGIPRAEYDFAIRNGY
jgi:hypothetical protein